MAVLIVAFAKTAASLVKSPPSIFIFDSNVVHPSVISMVLVVVIVWPILIIIVVWSVLVSAVVRSIIIIVIRSVVWVISVIILIMITVIGRSRILVGIVPVWIIVVATIIGSVVGLAVPFKVSVWSLVTPPVIPLVLIVFK